MLGYKKENHQLKRQLLLLQRELDDITELVEAHAGSSGVDHCSRPGTRVGDQALCHDPVQPCQGQSRTRGAMAAEAGAPCLRSLGVQMLALMTHMVRSGTCYMTNTPSALETLHG